MEKMTKKQADNHISEEVIPTRRRRSSHSSIHEGEGEGWAVSYSDLLMVLMSFFIIFYNTDDSTGEKIDSVLKELNLQGITVNKESLTKEEKEALIQDDFARKVASLELDGVTISKIQPEKVSTGKWNKLLKKGNDAAKYKGGIIIDLPDNIFANGKFELSNKTQKSLDHLLEVIKPYHQHLNLVFIGHTDAAPVNSKIGVIDSNLILSHVRAAKAVEYATGKGFDPMWVSSQGLSEFTRNTRSLSIRIMER